MKNVPSETIPLWCLMLPWLVVAGPTVSASAVAQDDPDKTAMTAFQNGAFAEALTGWMRAADAGDGRAARYVGVLFDTGEGVAQDQATALRWYRRAAALGDVPAMFNVAICYDAGRGAERDPVEAAAWYRQAATHRFGRAEYNLALMQESGDGVPRDRRAAALLFRAAWRDGITAARPHLSSVISLGRVESQPLVPAPSDVAFVAAQRALLSRSPEAASRAVALFAQAAGRIGPAAEMARYDLAWCYQNGIGIAANRTVAYRLFVQVAAQAGDAGLADLARSGAEASAPPLVTAQDASLPAAAER